MDLVWFVPENFPLYKLLLLARTNPLVLLLYIFAEAENIKKPVKALEEEVEKYKRDVLAEAKAKGSF